MRPVVAAFIFPFLVLSLCYLSSLSKIHIEPASKLFLRCENGHALRRGYFVRANRCGREFSSLWSPFYTWILSLSVTFFKTFVLKEGEYQKVESTLVWWIPPLL